MRSSEDIYWATKKDDELIDHLVEKTDQYYEFCRNSGLLELWYRSHKMYQWGSVTNTIEKLGEDGEFDGITVNHYRNFGRHIYVGTTGVRPAFQPRAVNTNYKSRVSCRLADGALEFYMKEKRCEEVGYCATDLAIKLGEAASYTWFDRNAGKFVDVEQVQADPEALEGEEGFEPIERPVFEGDIRVDLLHPLDMIRDVSRRSCKGMPWWILRLRINRYDLAALYPELRTEILAVSTEDSEHWQEREIRMLYQQGSQSWESDEIYVYHFLHAATPSLPEGRRVIFVGDILLEDATYAEAKIDKPLIHIHGDEIEGIPFFYTFMFDLMALQDAINTAHSTALTNMGSFGVTNLTGPAGAKVEFVPLTKGLNWLGLASARDGKIEVLDLLQIPEQLIALMDHWTADMETLSGVNSVRRGNPEASLKSGAALALVETTFVEFTKDFQASYALMWEDLGTQLVRLFRDHVPEPRLAAIVGKGNRAYVKELKGEDLAGVDCVKVETVGQLARTSAGRLELADRLLAQGHITTPEQYMAVLETGRLEPVTHHQQAELDLIQAENEALMEGNAPRVVLDLYGHVVMEPPVADPGVLPGIAGQGAAWTPKLTQQMVRPGAVVLVTDNHVLHIKEHNALLCDPEVRRNETVTAAVLAHAQEHINALLTLDPVLAAINGQPSIGAGIPTASPEGGPGSPRGSEGSSGNAVTLPVENPATGVQAQVTPPNDPRTGQDWAPGQGATA